MLSSFPFEDTLKQGNAFILLLFNCPLEHDIRKVQENNFECVKIKRTSMVSVSEEIIIIIIIILIIEERGKL